MIIARNLGVTSLIIEIDANSSFAIIRSRTITHKGQILLVLECRQFSQSFYNFWATHIYREVNEVADGIVKKAVVGVDDGSFDKFCCNYYDIPPMGLTDALLADTLLIKFPKLVCMITISYDNG